MKPYGFQQPYCIKRSGGYSCPDREYKTRFGRYRSKPVVRKFFKKNARRAGKKMIRDHLTEGGWQHTT